MEIFRGKTILWLVLGLSFISYRSYAGIGIDPVQVEIQAEKGTENNGNFKIYNTGEKPVKVTTRFEDWLHLGIEPSSWLNFEPRECIIEPSSFQEVRYTINIPIVSTGEFMAMAYFCSVEADSNIGADFGIPIYATVKGTEVLDTEVVEIQSEYVNEKGISGNVTLKNNGNVHIRPYVNMHILNEGGKSEAYFGAQFGRPVHVGKDRKFAFAKEDLNLVPGKYKLIATADYGSLYKSDKKAVKEVELIVAEQTVSNEDFIKEEEITETSLFETDVVEEQEV